VSGLEWSLRRADDSALDAVVLSALYLYVTQGKVPEAFDGAGLQQAFVAK